MHETRNVSTNAPLNFAPLNFTLCNTDFVLLERPPPTIYTTPTWPFFEWSSRLHNTQCNFFLLRLPDFCPLRTSRATALLALNLPVHEVNLHSADGTLKLLSLLLYDALQRLDLGKYEEKEGGG
jgi:hypothetical protein